MQRQAGGIAISALRQNCWYYKSTRGLRHDVIAPLASLTFLSPCCWFSAARSPSSLAAQSEADVNASLKKFTQVYEAVESNFADKVDPDNIVYRGAIPNMLRTLDPHSNFFDPKAYALMREGQSGHYFGVGMYVGAPDGTGDGDVSIPGLAGLPRGSAARRSDHRR